MRKVQSKVISKNWLHIIMKINISELELTAVEKLFAQRIKEYVMEDQEESICDQLVQAFLNFIFNGKPFLKYYDGLPFKLVEEVILETKGVRGLNFSRKIHSILIELMTYKYLFNNGYTVTSFSRTEGSCDLRMMKDSIEYNFEVKFKESPEILLSRYYDCLDGLSMIEEYSFLRNKMLDSFLKVDTINYENQKLILDEFIRFAKFKKVFFDGKYIQIFTIPEGLEDLKKKGKFNNAYTYSKFFKDTLLSEYDTKQLINKLFIESNGHVSKLIKKSKKFKNFKGCLSWHIPFHYRMDIKVIEHCFNELLELRFDLHVVISQTGGDTYNFIVPRK